MLPYVEYVDGSLRIEGVEAEGLAERYGTPLYVYSGAALREQYERVSGAFGALRPLVCYAVKASGNVHLLRALAGLGAGLDVVSGGELARARAAGVPGARIVFAGTGKTREEIRLGLGSGTADGAAIGWFNAESEEELERLAEEGAAAGVRPRVCLRVNPDVDAKTHRFTTTGTRASKFGVDIGLAPGIFERWGRDGRLFLRGMHVHLGSPIAGPEPYVEALWSILGVLDAFQNRGLAVQALNIGGGFGAWYGHREVQPIESFASRLVPLLRPRVEQGLGVILEPGRLLVSNAGVLLTRVQYRKESRSRRFVMCDAGVQTLLRPAFYDAYHAIGPASMRGRSGRVGLEPPRAGEGWVEMDVVGPICESSDYLAKDRALPADLRSGEVLAVFSAGAYGMSMASNYNDHPKPAEVLVEGGVPRLIRRRQRVEELIEPEMGLG